MVRAVPIVPLTKDELKQGALAIRWASRLLRCSHINTDGRELSLGHATGLKYAVESSWI